MAGEYIGLHHRRLRLVGALLQVLHHTGGRQHPDRRLLQGADREGNPMTSQDWQEVLWLIVLLCPVVALAVAR